MDPSASIIDEVKAFVLGIPCAHLVIYKVVAIESRIELTRHAEMSPYIKTEDRLTYLSNKYIPLATRYCQNRESEALKEIFIRRPPGGVTLVSPSSLGEFSSEVNEQGKRWWHLIIGSGPAADAGICIVARVAARDHVDVMTYIDRIQELFAAGDHRSI
jgi:hypothetical protein